MPIPALYRGPMPYGINYVLKACIRSCSKHFIGPTLSYMMYSLENSDKKTKNVHFFCPLCQFGCPLDKVDMPPPNFSTKIGKMFDFFSQI